MSASHAKPSVAVVYLARHAEGVYPMEAFLQSYVAHPSGIDHDLVIIYKGYSSSESLQKAKMLFAPYSQIALELPDEGFDLGPYYEAARQLPHEFLVCLNTFSEILDSDWLGKLYRQASLSDVGMVGVTASYESIADSVTICNKVAWFHTQPTSKSFKNLLDKYFPFVIPAQAVFATFVSIVYRDILSKDRPWTEKCSSFVHFFLKHAPKYLTWSYFVSVVRGLVPIKKSTQYDRWWSQRLDKQNEVAKVIEFPPFPNPHIRSNGFMMKREAFLATANGPIKTKEDAYAIESGLNSITAQVRSMGLRTLLVGRDGFGYDVADWPTSRIYRINDCSNLLIHDNRTRDYDRMTESARTTLAFMSWGLDFVKLPQEFPDIGIDFGRFRVAGLAKSRG